MRQLYRYTSSSTSRNSADTYSHNPAHSYADSASSRNQELYAAIPLRSWYLFMANGMPVRLFVAVLRKQWVLLWGLAFMVPHLALPPLTKRYG